MLIETAKEAAKHLMDGAVAAGDAAGVNLLVLQNGQELLYLESGYADIAEKKPIHRDTIFRLYSMSKPITGAAVMLLFERGLIDLADPVEKYLPGFAGAHLIKDGKPVPAPRPVLLHDLLSMTSGLSYGSDSVAGQAISAVIAEAEERLYSDNPLGTVELANRVGQCPLEFAPGEHFCYGLSADILGAVIEVASGMRFADFLRESFFEPLGMHDTGFYVPKDKQPRLVTAYEKNAAGGLTPFTRDHLAIMGRMDREPAFASGGAGLVSTLDDYGRFGTMLLHGGEFEGRRILEEATVRYFTGCTLQPWQHEDLQKSWPGLVGYSYGNLMRVMKDPSLALMQASPGEYGWDGWLGAYFSNHPGLGVTFLLGMQMTNAGTTDLTRRLRNVILTALS